MPSRPVRARLASTLGPRLGKGTAAGRAARWVYRHVSPDPPERPIGQLLAAFAERHPAAVFVQVGAHDGTQLDPLREEILRRSWTGVLVEPVPYVFARLERNYAGVDRVRFENAAVSDVDGTREFHFLRERSDADDVWHWYDALGSFRREVLLSHVKQVPDIAVRVVSAPMPCLTFDTLCAKHGLDHVDLVQIDTEGYDHEVVKLIDLERLGVQLVMYENLHLGAADRHACEALLASHGFELLSDGMDTLALRTTTIDDDGLRPLWDALAMAPAAG